MIFTSEMIDKLRERVRSGMSEWRFTHTAEVEKMAVRLGELYAPEKMSMLRAAALLHDITKEKSFDEQIEILLSHGAKVTDFDRCSPKTLHARTAELIIKDEYPEFADSEIIILAGGHNAETDKLIKREQFELMAPNALFVNIARGKMVDEKAMAEVAAEKEIFLALDVFEVEPLPEDSILRKNERVLLTPHRANNSIEFEERWKCLGSDIELFCTGKTPESALTVARAKVMSES